MRCTSQNGIPDHHLQFHNPRFPLSYRSTPAVTMETHQLMVGDTIWVCHEMMILPTVHRPDTKAQPYRICGKKISVNFFSQQILASQECCPRKIVPTENKPHAFCLNNNLRILMRGPSWWEGRQSDEKKLLENTFCFKDLRTLWFEAKQKKYLYLLFMTEIFMTRSRYWRTPHPYIGVNYHFKNDLRAQSNN